MGKLSAPLNESEILAELDWLRRLAKSLVGSAGVDEDLVQETWLAASRIDGGVSRAWLVGTLRKLASNWFRRESRHRQRDKIASRPEAVNLDAVVERSELLGVVLDELRGLSSPYRAVLLLIYQEGLSVREVADQLTMPVDTVRWQHREGLDRLRQKLDHQTHGASDWRAALLPLLASDKTALQTSAAATSIAAKVLHFTPHFLMSWKLTTVAVLAGLALLFTLDFGEEKTPTLPIDGLAKNTSFATIDASGLYETSAQSKIASERMPVTLEAEVQCPAANASFEWPASEQPASGIGVRILNADGAPAKGAMVLQWRLDEYWSRVLGEQPDVTAAELGQRWKWRWYEAGEDGRVLLPEMPLGCRVVASLDSRWAGALFPALSRRTSRLVTLTLEQPKSLTFAAIDEEGRLRQDALLRPLLVTSTGRRGIFMPVQTFDNKVAELSLAFPLLEELEESRQVRLSAFTPLERAETTVSLDVARKSGVRTILTTLTEVKIRLVTPEGAPISGDPLNVSFYQTLKGVDKEKHLRGIQVENGSFDFLGFDPDALFRITVSGTNIFAVEHKGISPALGGSVVLEIAIPQGRSFTVTGSIVSKSGEPRTQMAFAGEITLRDSDGTLARTHLEGRTDKAGNFEVTCESAFSKNVSIRNASLQLGLLDGAHLLSTASRELVFEAPLEDLLQVGELSTRPAKLLAKGRVVDAQGKPIPGIDLMPCVPHPTSQRHTNSKESPLPPLWTRSLYQTTDAQGNFAFYIAERDFPDCDRLVMEGPDSTNLIPLGDNSAAIGDENLTVRFARAGRLEGTLALEGLDSRDRAYAQLIPAGSEETVLAEFKANHSRRKTSLGFKWSAYERQIVRRDGVFKWAGLMPGQYTLWLFHGDEHLKTVDGILITPGQMCQDQRLANIDLFPDHQAVVLDVRDSNGNPIAEGEIRILDYDWAREVTTVRDGRAVLRSNEFPLDVIVTSVGFTETEITGLTEDQEVTLEDGIRLRLALGSSIDLQEGKFIGISIMRRVPIEEYPVGAGSEEHPLVFSKGAELEIQLSGPGTYVVEATVLQTRREVFGDFLFKRTFEVTAEDRDTLRLIETPTPDEEYDW